MALRVLTADMTPEARDELRETLRPKVSTPATATRLTSLDAYRGFIMLVMASAGFNFALVYRHLFSANWPWEPDQAPSPIWRFLAYQFDHVPWVGCSFWDLIQPSFMFMVGVAIPFSHASRQAKGQSPGTMYKHALIRSFILILLAVFLSTPGHQQTNFVFVNVLAQIGLGYMVVYFLRGRGLGIQFLAVGIILAGYWLLFYLHPLPGPDFDFGKVGLSANWPHLTGLAAHWDKNTNVAAEFDRWFLNLFPRDRQFEFDPGGYTTLNFIPSIATMIFGIMAGELLQKPITPVAKLGRLFLAGLLCMLAGVLIDHLIWPDWVANFMTELGTRLNLSSSSFFDRNWTVCPIVKRIWTPSWAVFSAGWTFLILALFYGVVDVLGFRWWAFPLVVVGMNSIAIYCMSQLLKPWILQSLQLHLGQHLFDGVYGPIVSATAVLFVLWLICFWMYRQKIFVRI
jgi:predicted acyltransferase